MTVFCTRNQLLDWIEKHIVIGKIKRAMQDMPVENLGAFGTPVRGFREPGWIIKVILPLTKVVKYVCVIVIEDGYRIIVTEAEPLWETWAGEGCENSVYCGDHPEIYKELRDGQSRKTE